MALSRIKREMDEGIKIEQHKSGIGLIEFFSKNHNSLPSKVLSNLSDAIQDMSVDDSCRAIILRSSGDRTFCAGASLDELLAISSFEEGKAFFNGFASVINACRKSRKMIIGRIQGKAVGGGVGLIAACDYTFASKYAAIRLSELNIGIGPFVVGPAIERKIGLVGLTELSLNPESFYSAEWAQNRGLYNQIAGDSGELDAIVDDFASNLCKMSPDALREWKKCLWRGSESWDALLYERAEISGRLVLGEDAQKAISAFKNKV